MARARGEVWQDGAQVHKDHGGADGVVRALTAAVAMGVASSAGLPVPAVLGVEGTVLRMVRIADATSGVTLLQRDPGRLLRALGGFARQLHALSPPVGLLHLESDEAVSTRVWVHGDLCPVNVLVDADDALVGVLDWEDSHVGDGVIDLVWTEWLVRTLHPSATASLPALYSAYGSMPDEPTRRAAMTRCLDRHRRRAVEGNDPDDASLWDRRIAGIDGLDLSMPG